MQITVLATTNTTVPTAKGSYQKLEVTYKDDQGKTASRPIMSFVKDSKAAYDALVNASQGETFNVSMVKQTSPKDGKEYWVWTNATRGTAGATQATTAATSSTTTPVAKGNWETPEERAKKQIYIIRQSSLSTAVAALSVGSKVAPKDVEILALAKKFEDYVFDGLTGNFAVDTASLEDDNFQDLPN